MGVSVRHRAWPPKKGDEKELRKVQEECPYCGVELVTLLDDFTRVHGCRCGRYWTDKEGVTEELHRLTVAEASVKMASLNKRYVEEVEQLSKIDLFKDIPHFSEDDIQEPRQGQLELMRDGKLMVFITSDAHLIYTFIEGKP